MRIGTTELIVVIIIALVIFGPGKLPELGRMLGKAIGSIRHYSDPNTWEKQAAAEEAELRKEEREPAEEGASTSGEAGKAGVQSAPTTDGDGQAAVSEAVKPDGQAAVSEAVKPDGQTAASEAAKPDGQAAASEAVKTDGQPAASEAAKQDGQAAPEDGLPIHIDVSEEISEEDAAHFNEMEGKSIDEIASSLLKSASKQDADQEA